MTYEQALYTLVSETGLTLTVDNGIVDEASFVSNVTFFADANDPRIPTWGNVTAKLAELQAAYDAQEYARNRAEEYPSIQEVTVALAEKTEGDSTMWDEITAKRAAIKTKYPKPE